jgi:NTE family protein
MFDALHNRSSRRIGLALSGGSVRGLAHIGIIKALHAARIRPTVIVGTSVGSLIGAAIAAGMHWEQLREIACSVFWPSLLTRRGLERFCSTHLPATFADLKIPFAAIATTLPHKRAVVMSEGSLASAISASCAMRVVRRPVLRNGHRLKDGGIACVLPAAACRDLGAELVIGSDVWEISSALRTLGLGPNQPLARHAYPAHFRAALRQTDLLIQPDIPPAGYVPGLRAVDLMIEAGDRAARAALSSRSGTF